MGILHSLLPCTSRRNLSSPHLTTSLGRSSPIKLDISHPYPLGRRPGRLTPSPHHRDTPDPSDVDLPSQVSSPGTFTLAGLPRNTAHTTRTTRTDIDHTAIDHPVHSSLTRSTRTVTPSSTSRHDNKPHGPNSSPILLLPSIPPSPSASTTPDPGSPQPSHHSLIPTHAAHSISPRLLGRRARLSHHLDTGPAAGQSSPIANKLRKPLKVEGDWEVVRNVECAGTARNGLEGWEGQGVVPRSAALGDLGRLRAGR